MSAIQTIIETYIKFADEQALLRLRAHRLRLLATIGESDPFSKSLRSQCVGEISAIEAGLARLRPPAAPLPDVAAPEPVVPEADRAPTERASADPVAGHDVENVVAAQANDFVISPHRADAETAPATSDSVTPRPVAASASDPSLIAGSVLAASLATRTQPGSTNLTTELLKLQLRLTMRLKG